MIWFFAQTIRRTPPMWFAGKIGRCACESEQCSGTGGRIPGGHFQGVAVFVVVRRPSPFSFWFFVFVCSCASFVRTFLQVIFLGPFLDKNFVALLDSGFRSQRSHPATDCAQHRLHARAGSRSSEATGLVVKSDSMSEATGLVRAVLIQAPEKMP